MLKLLVVIYNNEKKIKNILKKYKLRFNLMTYGSGTASPSLLNYFGLDEVKKSIYFSLIPSSLEKKILMELETKLQLKEIGKGIGFTISLTSSYKFVEDILGKGEEVVKEETGHYELVITIVKEGYSDLVMQAAKRKGATGGTVIYGRSLGSNRTILANLSIEPEKDVVLNIVKKEDKKEIMQSINQKVGINTDGNGLLISLPIDNVIGLQE